MRPEKPGFSASLPKSHTETRSVLSAAIGHFTPKGVPTERLELALAEALNNFVMHAQKHSGGNLSVTYDADRGRFDCELIDDASAYAPPDAISLSGKPSTNGYGWHILRSICAETHLSRVENENRLHLSIPA